LRRRTDRYSRYSIRSVSHTNGKKKHTPLSSRHEGAQSKNIPSTKANVAASEHKTGGKELTPSADRQRKPHSDFHPHQNCAAIWQLAPFRPARQPHATPTSLLFSASYKKQTPPQSCKFFSLL